MIEKINIDTIYENTTYEEIINYKDYLINPLESISKPPSILSVIQQSATQTIEIDVMSEGDFSLLIGQQKSKKTFFTSLVFSSMLLSGSVDNKLISKLRNKKVAYFDTEQSKWHSFKTAQRISRIVQGQKFDYFHLRSLSTEKRKSLIDSYLKENQEVGFLVIDGIVDLLNDFNDLKESKELVQWIMTITERYNIHILLILHTNFSDGKARGHLGSILGQKAETVFKIEKNKDIENQSIISAHDTRGKSFNDFEILIDANGNPHLIERDFNSYKKKYV